MPPERDRMRSSWSLPLGCTMKRSTCLVEPAVHAPDRSSHDPRRLGARHLLDGAQDEDRRLLERETRERNLEVLGRFLCVEDVGRGIGELVLLTAPPEGREEPAA